MAGWAIGGSRGAALEVYRIRDDTLYGAYRSPPGDWEPWTALLPVPHPVKAETLRVVARTERTRHAFVVGEDGILCTAAVDSGGGEGWSEIPELMFSDPIFQFDAVSREPTSLDVVGISESRDVHISRWLEHVNGGRWSAWQRIGVIGQEGTFSGLGNAANVRLLKRDGGALLVVAELDSLLYAAAWNRNAADGVWQGWWETLTSLDDLQETGGTAFSLDAIVNAFGTVDIITFSNAGKLCWVQSADEEGRQWGDWTSLISEVTGSPTVHCAIWQGELQVFTLLGKLRHIPWRDGSIPLPERGVPDAPSAVDMAVVEQASTVDVVLRLPEHDAHLCATLLEDGRWTEWTPIP